MASGRLAQTATLLLLLLLLPAPVEAQRWRVGASARRRTAAQRRRPAQQPPASDAAQPARQPMSKGGALGGLSCGKSISRPMPRYPPEAKEARVQGLVTVKVLVGEEGNVLEAEAVSGHPLLAPAAVSAARQARFSPTLVSGKPVKLTGVMTYNFVLQ